MIIIEVYVDDIIFGSDDNRLSWNFEKDMQNEFEMYLLGQFTFFWDSKYLSQMEAFSFFKQAQQKNVEEVQNGRIQTCEHSYGHRVHAKKIR